MKVLIAAAGSHGDVLPFIALGQALKLRGHDARLFANGSFEPLAREAALPFTATGCAAELASIMKSPAAIDSRKGTGLLAASIMSALPATHEAMRLELVPGRTLLVGSSLAFSTRLLGETHRVPCATVHLSPAWFRSNLKAPAFSPLGHLAHTPQWFKRWLWGAMDRRFFDPTFTTPFNRIRADLGLAPVARMLHEWIHGADLTLGMFPAWFAEPQPDWPQQLRLTDFPLYDHGTAGGLPAPVQAFLDAGDPPIAYTAGTANSSSEAFFVASMQACVQLKRRGLLIAPRDQAMAALPPGVARFDYVPFKALLPRVAAFVHHGGIGSTSQALLAGVPQLIRPMGFDQFDNAQRLMQLGVARQLLTRRYQAHTVARALDELIHNSRVKQRCTQIAAQMHSSNGIVQACDTILNRLAPHLPA